MKNKILGWVLAAIVISFMGCKKEDYPTEWVHAYIDVPFEMAPTQPCYLLDTIVNTQTGQKEVHRIEVRITSIDEHRSFGGDCDFVYGTSAKINGIALLSDGSEVPYGLYMPGCTNGEEWTTNNNNIPKQDLVKHRLYLLKLNPYDSKPKHLGDYRIKYVIKRK